MQRASLRSARSLLAIGAIAIASLAIACTDEEDPTPEATGTGTAVTATATTEATQATETATTGAETTGTPAGDAPRAEVDPAACSDVAEAMTGAFPDQTLIEDQSAFSAGDLTGEGCRVLVTGTAEELPTFVEVSQTLRGILEDAGWTENMDYVADGPSGTIAVYEQDGSIAVMSAGVAPEDPTACPADQVISECLDGLEPSEVMVQGSIIVAAE